MFVKFYITFVREPVRATSPLDVMLLMLKFIVGSIRKSVANDTGSKARRRGAVYVSIL